MTDEQTSPSEGGPKAKYGRPGREVLHELLRAAPEGLEPKDLCDQYGASASSFPKWAGPKGLLFGHGFIERRDDTIHLGPGLGYVLAIGVGGERLHCGLVDAAGVASCVKSAKPEPNQLKSRPHQLLGRIRELAIACLTEANAEGSAYRSPDPGGGSSLKIVGVTAAWPAPINRAWKPQGLTLGGVDHADEWRKSSMREHLSRGLGIPLERVHAANDANAAALETSFAASDEADGGTILVVHMSAGIGMGTIHQALPRPHRKSFIESHLAGGAQGLAGEVGHCPLEPQVIKRVNREGATEENKSYAAEKRLPVLALGGQCSCHEDASKKKAYGHLESVIGAKPVLQRVGLYGGEDSSLAKGLEDLHIKAVDHSLYASALEDVGKILAWTLQGTVASLDPSQIWFTGPLASRHVVRGYKRAALDPEDQIAASRASVDFRKPNESLLIPMRGAALAVLRAGVHRRFFERFENIRDGEVILKDLPHNTRPSQWDYSPLGGDVVLGLMEAAGAGGKRRFAPSETPAEEPLEHE